VSLIAFMPYYDGSLIVLRGEKLREIEFEGSNDTKQDDDTMRQDDELEMK
jgi:hypothetical protein